MIEAAIKDYLKEIEMTDILPNVPIHSILPRMPELGTEYGKELKILFLGQDANNLYTEYDEMIKDNIYSYILELNEDATAFDFVTETQRRNNFITWYKKWNYTFWEFPIVFISKKYGLNLNPGELSQELLDSSQKIRYYYSTFGWGNISSILFRNILERNYNKMDPFAQKVDFAMYDKIFQIASRRFSTIEFFEKIYQPDLIIVLTAKFDPHVFFQSKTVEKTFVDSANFITKYEYVGKKPITVISSYHPSYMKRMGNSGGLSISQYADKILQLCEH